MFFSKKPAPQQAGQLQLSGDVWLNTDQPTDNLAPGKVTLTEFWTFGCINCRNTIPHMQRLWQQLGQEPDFQFIGVHRPEFDYEHAVDNVLEATKQLGVSWPVLIDNNYTNWDLFQVHYWPSFFVQDKQGRLVHSQVGEGGYDKLAAIIINLLSTKS